MLPSQVKSQIAEANAHFDATPPVDAPASVEPAPPTPPVVVAPAETVPKKDHDLVVQQLKSLQGIHRSIDTDRAALRAQVATLSETVRTLTEQVEQFRAVSTAPKLITDAEVTEYTPELLDLISRKAQETFGPQIAHLNTIVARLTERNAQLEQTLTGVASHTERVVTKTFLESISELMPAWNTVNDDPGFMDWLQQPNPLTGKPYAVDFYAARDAKDAPRIVEFFRTYAGMTPPSVAPSPPAVTPPSLESLVAPATGGNEPAPAAPNKRVWTQKAIAEFYKDKANGRWVNSPQVAQVLEADLFKAQGEGRVTA